MNKRVKRMWIRALRSGKYQQARGSLKKTTDEGGAKYCCLGVLCEIALKHGIIDSYAGSNGLQPDAVTEWAEFGDEADPVLGKRKIDGKELFATVMNDEGKSFKWIADRIEEYL